MATSETGEGWKEKKEVIRKIATRLQQNIKKKEFWRVVAMLKKPMEARTNKDFRDVKPIMEKCQFIKDINLPLNDVDMIDFCKQLKYKFVPSGENIYKRGGENNCIYFILKGKAAITYPAKTEKEQ